MRVETIIFLIATKKNITLMPDNFHIILLYIFPAIFWGNNQIMFYSLLAWHDIHDRQLILLTYIIAKLPLHH